MSDRVYIMTGGEPPVVFPHIDGFVIACEAGCLYANRHCITPDIAMGDFDTILDAPYRAKETIRFPKDKDYSDTELCIRKATELFPDCRITIIGGGGGRMDHLMNLYSLISRYPNIDTWLTRHESMHVVQAGDAAEFDCGTDDNVSFMPANLEDSCVVCCKDLVWPLENYRLSVSTMSLSNRAACPKLSVVVRSGCSCLVSFLQGE